MIFTNVKTNEETGVAEKKFSVGRLVGGVLYAAVGAIIGIGTAPKTTSDPRAASSVNRG
jgi:hypothetical protein